MPKRNKSPFTKPLTRKRARKEVKAAGRLAVGPEQRILKAERRTSKVQSRRIRDWFPQYGQAVGQAAERTAGAYQDADQQIASASDASTAFAEQMRQRLSAEAQSSANLRGVQTDTSGSLTNAQAQIARRASSDTLRGVTTSQGAAQGAYFADKQRIGQREKIEQLLQEQERRRSYTQDLRDLAKRKSDTMIQEKGRLRDSERDYHLGLLAAKEPGKARKFERGQAAKDRKLSKGEAKKDRRFNRNQAKQDRKGADGDGGGGGGNKTDLRRASSYLRQGVNVNKLTPKNKRKAIDYLINRGVDPSIARRVVGRALKKGGGGNKGGKWWDKF